MTLLQENSVITEGGTRSPRFNNVDALLPPRNRFGYTLKNTMFVYVKTSLG